MPGKTNISWATDSWNPVSGCSKVSEGCNWCYAEALSLRYGWSKKPWTPENAQENVILHPERLGIPGRWKKPRRIFVNSMSDLFHPLVPGEFINRVWVEMFNNPRHTYVILTKRPKRMRDWTRIAARAKCWPEDEIWPDWIWVGTSVENRDHLERVDLLRETPAAVRVISAEPLLGPLIQDCDCDDAETPHWRGDDAEFRPGLSLEGIHWLIAGGESGSQHRPMEISWLGDLKEACDDAGTAFWAKQDSAYRNEQRGRIPDDLWVHQLPSAARAHSETLL